MGPFFMAVVFLVIALVVRRKVAVQLRWQPTRHTWAALGAGVSVEKLDRVFVRILCGVGQPRVVPAEVLDPARVGGRHQVARISGEIQEGMLEDPLHVVAGGELRNGVMHILVGLVLQLQSDDGQAVEEENEIDLLI